MMLMMMMMLQLLNPMLVIRAATCSCCECCCVRACRGQSELRMRLCWQPLLDEVLDLAQLGVHVAPFEWVCPGCLGDQDVHVRQQHPAQTVQQASMRV
jgi:hypothetical protein